MIIYWCSLLTSEASFSYGRCPRAECYALLYVWCGYFISIGATSAGRLELYFALFSDGQSTMSFTGKLSTGKGYFI